jgi:hypothetical protein
MMALDKPEKASSAHPGHPGPHAWLASAYALDGEAERAAAELAEARRLTSDDRYSNLTRFKLAARFSRPICALAEGTYFAGLRKAGMPEE